MLRAARFYTAQAGFENRSAGFAKELGRRVTDNAGSIYGNEAKLKYDADAAVVKETFALPF
jgi:hypothetical protein